MSTHISKKQETAEPYVLRRVSDENAFYFYKDVGMPLGKKANSLEEFSNELRDVDSTSVKFHSERHDFENWVKMLGDPALADQISSLTRQTRAPEKLKPELSRTVESRVKSLRRSPS